MRIIIFKNANDVAQEAAQFFVKRISAKLNAVLGLATGSTVLPLYRELIRANQQSRVSFKQITTFNLDEYLGIKSDHPQSYRQFMNEQLFQHIDIHLQNTFLPTGDAEDPLQACKDYEI